MDQPNKDLSNNTIKDEIKNSEINNNLDIQNSYYSYYNQANYISYNCSKLLYGLLANLKQLCFNFRIYQNHVNVLISSLENIIEYYIFNFEDIKNINVEGQDIYSKESVKLHQKSSIEKINIKFYNFNEGILSFIYLYFKEENTTNSLTSIYLNFIYLYFENMKEIKELFYHSHKSLILLIIEIIYTKNLEYTNKIDDCKNILITSKILLLLIDICSIYDDINMNNIINYFFNSNQILYSLSDDFLLESNTDLIICLTKSLFLKCKKFSDRSQIYDIAYLILKKLLDFCSQKENIKSNMSYSAQNFYFNNLICCLKATSIISECKVDQYDSNNNNLVESNSIFENDLINQLVVKVLVNLSLWDNASILEHSCNIIIIYVKECFKNKNTLKFDIEIIIEYFFNKRISDFYDILKSYVNNDNKLSTSYSNSNNNNNYLNLIEDVDIKLSILEIIIEYIDILLSEYNLIEMCYSSYDISKLTSSVFSNLIKNLNKYYEFNHRKFNFIKKLISSINIKILKFILNIHNDISKEVLESIKSNNSQENNKNLYNIIVKNYSNNSEFWIDIINKINNGKFKVLFKHLQESFGVIDTTPPKKKSKKDSKIESKENSFDCSNNSDNKSEKDLNNSSSSSNNNNLIINVESNLNNKDELKLSGLNSNNNVNNTIDNNSDVNNTSLNSMDLNETNTTRHLHEENINPLKNIIIRNEEIAKLIAIILRYSKLVDVNIIFEYIGINHDFSLLIRKEYLKTFNFSDMDILEAYRLFVSTFKLGGESFILYNIILEFSKKYYSDNINNTVFTSEDEVSAFAYSILMLNTDLHDPYVKEHMKIDEFITSNKRTGYFSNIKDDFFKSIYISIQKNPLKIAKARTSAFDPKSNEIFEIIKCKKNYCYINKNTIINKINSNNKNIIDNSNEVFNNLSKNYNTTYACNILSNLKTYPYSLVLDDVNIYNKNKLNSTIIDDISKYILIDNMFEDYFSSFIMISNNYFTTNDNLNLNKKIINLICEISTRLNKYDYINKILSIVTKILCDNQLYSGKLELYNLYFTISIQYSIKFEDNSKNFFNNIIEFIRMAIDNQTINNSKSNSLSNEYLNKLYRIIDNCYIIIYKKKHFKKEGYFGFIFGSSNNEEEFFKGFEVFKLNIMKNLKLTYNSNNPNSLSNKSLPVISNIESFDNNSNVPQIPLNCKFNDKPDTTLKNNLYNFNTNNKTNSNCINNEHNFNVELSSIIKLIISREDELLFFTNYAYINITESRNIYEIYYSYIFINEVLKQKLNQTEFMKIWHNLVHIHTTKCDIDSNFGEKDSYVFDILLMNNFIFKVISDYVDYIEIHDYYAILEKFFDTENIDLIYSVLESNDIIIQKNKSSVFAKKELVLESILILIEKFLLLAVHNNISAVNSKLNDKINNKSISYQDSKKLLNVVDFMCNILEYIDDINCFSSDGIQLLGNIIKTIKSKPIINEEHLFNLVKLIINKIQNTKISLIDSKWDLFVQILKFVLEAILNNSLKTQADYLNLLNILLLNIKIPLLKIKELINILNIFYTNSISVYNKSESYWEGIFKVFYNIIASNDELVLSDHEMSNLWNLFIRKYLISYVDSMRAVNKLNEINKSSDVLVDIVNYLKSKCKIYNYLNNYF